MDDSGSNTSYYLYIDTSSRTLSPDSMVSKGYDHIIYVSTNGELNGTNIAKTSGGVQDSRIMFY